MEYFKILATVIFFMLQASAFAVQNVCFTPHENCHSKVLKYINSAKSSIYIQAYNLSSPDLVRAIKVAKKRGVIVKVILDKNQWLKYYPSSTKTLLHAGIPVWIDYKPIKAANNTLIIDGNKILTGTLDFHQSSEKSHSANLLIIEDKDLAFKFMNQWSERQRVSKRVLYQVKGGVATAYAGFQNYGGASTGSIAKLYIQFRN